MADISYYLRDVQEAIRKIVIACPHVHLDNWGDYGFKLVAFPNGAGQAPAVILFQPGRFIGEETVATDAATLDRFIEEWRR